MVGQKVVGTWRYKISSWDCSEVEEWEWKNRTSIKKTIEIYYDPKLIRNLRNKLEVSAVFLHNQGIVGESPQAQQQSAKSPENPAIRIDMTLTQ